MNERTNGSGICPENIFVHTRINLASAVFAVYVDTDTVSRILGASIQSDTASANLLTAPLIAPVSGQTVVCGLN